jgi:hypothetical protein
MMRTPKKKGATKKRQRRGDQSISVEAAAMAFAFLSVVTNNASLEQAVKLALRAPEPMRTWARQFVEAGGGNVDLISGNATPATKAEVMGLAAPSLKNGIGMVSVAQLFDIYLLGRDRTPENVVYTFYIMFRFWVAGERRPSKEQINRIWALVLEVASTSNIGASHWKELESKGPYALNDWLDEVKANSRKKFKTFLSQKKRLEATADKTFRSLMGFLFDDSEQETS